MSAVPLRSRSQSRRAYCGQTTALLGALLLLQGCQALVVGGGLGAAFGAYKAKEIGVKQGAPVQIRFRPAMDVTFISGTHDSSRMVAAELVVGRVMYMHGDSLLIRASEVRAGGKRLFYGAQGAPRLIVTRTQGVIVEPIGDSFSYVVTGAVMGVTMALLGFFGLCAATNCLGD